MRLIDADAIFDENHCYTTFNKNLDYCDDSDIAEWIDKQPTVDAEPVRHGRWTEGNRMPNREERRKYVREHKKHPLAKYCPVCHGKTLHIAFPKYDWKCDIICECCRTVFEQDAEGYIPYTYC